MRPIYFYTIFHFICSGMIFPACDRSGQGQSLSRPFLTGKDFVADVEKGKQLFVQHCASCHGQSALGTNTGPPLIHATYRPGHHADLSFFWAVKDGAKQHHWHFGDMPPIADMTADEVGHIVSFIRTEQRQAGIK